ncbi:hypothetical protein BX616_002950 [Lobosporangium transversale]|nr:hypothetical protein BX616_002950 [Lobosporangium transversale]
MYPQSGHPYGHPQPGHHAQQHPQQPPPPYGWTGYPQVPVSSPYTPLPHLHQPSQHPHAHAHTAQHHPYYQAAHRPTSPSPSSEPSRPLSGGSYHPTQYPPHQPLSPAPPYYAQQASSLPASPSVVLPSSSVSIAPTMHPTTPTSPGAPPIFYKAEMTESQAQTWKQQRVQQNIKVEVSSSTTQSINTPPSSSSTSSSAYRPVQTSQQQTQPELQRKTQLQALHNRQSSSFNAGPPSPQPSASWSHSSSGASPSSAHSPYPPTTPLSHTAAASMQPMPVEYQSSLTDNIPIPNYDRDSSLTTLDPAPAVTTGINARVSRPYSSTQDRPAIQPLQGYPSAIEHQSSLTEMDATSRTSSGVYSPSRTESGLGSGSGPGFSGRSSQFSSTQYPNRQSPNQSPYPSAIENQSSLTEVDNLPFPIEAQSALTEIDDRPYPIEEQSALTEVDNLPHPLKEQSALTEVDNLPHPLESQSALTEIDNLPHPLEAQSPLTEVDNRPYVLSGQSSLTEVDESIEKLRQTGLTATKDGIKLKPKTAPSSEPTTSTAITTATAVAFSTTSTDVDANADADVDVDAGAEDKDIDSASSPVSPAMKALTDVAASSFSMSNWTMPSDFTNPMALKENESLDDVKNLLSPTGSLHKRSPATIHIDTTLAEAGRSTPVLERTESTSLNPITPTITNGFPVPESPIPKSLLSSGSLTRKAKSPVSGTPPIPAPKPAALTAAKASHPQAGSSGSKPTISEEVYIPFPTERVDLIPVQDAPLLQEENEGDEDENDDDEEEEEDDLDHVDDGVSAFIRELQSSMPLSRSGSGSRSVLDPLINEDLGAIRRSDSSSSQTSQQKGVDFGAEVPKQPTVEPQQAVTAMTASEEGQDNFQYEDDLQQLEATQFEWTFTESEQATYERIFGLWERPAEECVSSDIAGKVFMTLGLPNSDLYKIWQLLNPEEKPALTRTEFIAGLHLVNCKAIGYELPTELPDELMLSAAAVGRVSLPPRPIQGPSTLLSNGSEPTFSAVTTAAAKESSSFMLPLPVPMVQEQSTIASSPGNSDFMNMYNPLLGTFNSPPGAFNPSELSQGQQKPDESDIYVAYPYQPPQPPFPHQDYQELHQHQQYDSVPQPGHVSFEYQYQPSLHQYSYEDAMPAAPHPKPHPPVAPETPVTPSKPGPHALHDLPADAPVFLSMEDELLLRNSGHDRPRSAAPDVIQPSSSSFQASPSSSSQPPTATQPSAGAIIKNRHSVDNPDLYLSPPDAWDHDDAPPELDVEGSYIKYRSDFKNDMTVSASVTANHPINPQCGLFYFEITIDAYKEVKGSTMSVGIASKALRKNCQVGWDLNSWGYHSDDGYLYFGNGKQSIKYAYEYKENDVVGCGINFVDRAVFFTLNGDMLGVAFRFIKDTIPLYPAIGLSHAGTEINANFGDQTFLFNIVDYKKIFKVLSDGLSVIAHDLSMGMKGRSSSAACSGCIRGPKVSPRDKDVFYFEVTILYMPPTNLGTIVVGICGKDQSMTETLGWKENSYGYSSDENFLSLSNNRPSLNARSQSGKMKARARGQPFKAGSIVGCGVDFASREIFFTLNGECLGQAFYGVDVLDCYPCVSVVEEGGGVGGPLSQTHYLNREQSTLSQFSSSNNNTIGFEFKANFGQYPFVFDLPEFEASEGQ